MNQARQPAQAAPEQPRSDDLSEHLSEHLSDDQLTEVSAGLTSGSDAVKNAMDAANAQIKAALDAANAQTRAALEAAQNMVNDSMLSGRFPNTGGR